MFDSPCSRVDIRICGQICCDGREKRRQIGAFTLLSDFDHNLPKCSPREMLVSFSCCLEWINLIDHATDLVLVEPWHFSVKDQDRSFVSNAGITVTESNAYVQCGVSGFGIIQAPGIAVAKHLESRGLVEILKPYRPAPRPVSLLYPSRTHLAPQVQAFIEWLQERFPKLHSDWLEL